MIEFHQLSKKAQKKATEWAARVERDSIHVGQLVRAKRVTTDSRDYILTQWWEPAFITEVRRFDAVVKFEDGTTSSSGLGLEILYPYGA